MLRQGMYSLWFNQCHLHTQDKTNPCEGEDSHPRPFLVLSNRSSANKWSHDNIHLARENKTPSHRVLREAILQGCLDKV